MTLIVCCTKKCHKKAVQFLKGPALMWFNDGPSSTVSSETLLVKWFTTGNDCSRCCGGPKQSGKTKDALLQNAQAIQTKMNNLLQTHHIAKKWQKMTGRGVTCKASVRKALTNRCVCFHDLDPVPHDGPFVTPLVMSCRMGIMGNSSDVSDGSDNDEDDDDKESPTSGAMAPGSFDAILESDKEGSPAAQPASELTTLLACCPAKNGLSRKKKRRIIGPTTPSADKPQTSKDALADLAITMRIHNAAVAPRRAWTG